jgi:hypothetical protein
MNKFRITTAIATTALFTFGLAAGSVSAASTSTINIVGQCFEVDGNGYPHPVDCPPELELPGPTDPFADRCYEETFGGLEIPVPCPEDGEDRSFVPILPGTFTPLPGTITFPWLGGSGDGEGSTETDEAVEETPAAEEEAPATEVGGDDGSDLRPDVEGAVIAEEAPVEETSADESSVEAEVAPVAATEIVESASSRVAVSTNQSTAYPMSDILIDETGESTEIFEASFESAAVASVDSVTDVISPEVIVEDAAEQSSSLGLIAAIMLVLLGGGALAGVGVLATRKQS